MIRYVIKTGKSTNTYIVDDSILDGYYKYNNCDGLLSDYYYYCSNRLQMHAANSFSLPILMNSDELNRFINASFVEKAHRFYD